MFNLSSFFLLLLTFLVLLLYYSAICLVLEMEHWNIFRSRFSVPEGSMVVIKVHISKGRALFIVYV